MRCRRRKRGISRDNGRVHRENEYGARYGCGGDGERGARQLRPVASCGATTRRPCVRDSRARADPLRLPRSLREHNGPGGHCARREHYNIRVMDATLSCSALKGAFIIGHAGPPITRIFPTVARRFTRSGSAVSAAVFPARSTPVQLLPLSPFSPPYRGTAETGPFRKKLGAFDANEPDGRAQNDTENPPLRITVVVSSRLFSNAKLFDCHEYNNISMKMFDRTGDGVVVNLFEFSNH